jgi:hypothetical protein
MYVCYVGGVKSVSRVPVCYVDVGVFRLGDSSVVRGTCELSVTDQPLDGWV